MERLIWSITSASFCADGVEGGVEGWLCANAGGIKPPPRRRTTRMTRTTRQRNARLSSGVAFEPRFMTALLLSAEDLDDPPHAHPPCPRSQSSDRAQRSNKAPVRAGA